MPDGKRGLKREWQREHEEPPRHRAAQSGAAAHPEPAAAQQSVAPARCKVSGQRSAPEALRLEVLPPPHEDHEQQRQQLPEARRSKAEGVTIKSQIER